MLSERTYWGVLLVFLFTVIVVDLFWIMPVYWYDLGVNILADAVFTIFTILFLTWIVKSRENSAWKLVEKEVLKRISRHLGEILMEIEDFFLSGFEIPEITKMWEKGTDISPHDKVRMVLDRDRGPYDTRIWPLQRMLLEHYTVQEPIKLGKAWDELRQLSIETRDPIILAQTLSFKTHGEYLEHVVSDYSRFLHPKLTHSIMQIQNSLDNLTVYLAVYRLKPSPANPRAHAHSIFWIFMGINPSEREIYEGLLASEISRIIRELKEVEEFIKLDVELQGEQNVWVDIR